MSIRTWIVAALALAAFPLVAGAGVVHSAVHGKLEPVAQDGAERGRFRLVVATRSNGSHVEKLEADARHLDPTLEYHVFLVKTGGTDPADFGAMTVNAGGHGKLRFTTRLTSLPSGVTSIADYAGGTVEVRQGDTAVLSDTVPTFIGLTDGGTPGAAAFGHDASRLRAVDTSFHGRGQILARRQNLPGGVREELRLTVGRMDNGATYTAYALFTDGSDVQLGTFTTSDPLGRGGFRLATAHGDTIPGPGSILDLAGLTVEVRDANGVAVLTGTFPTIP
jgi:hypothetical protein